VGKRIKAAARGKRVLLVLVVMCFASMSLGRAHGFEIFGFHLWGKKSGGEENFEVIGEPKTYQVTLDGAGDEALTKIMRQASGLMADKDKPVSGSAGLIAKAQADYRRILAALYEQGYYGGTISITVNGHEVADFELDSDIPDQSTIVIAVDTGAPYHFTQAEIGPLSETAFTKKPFRLFGKRAATKPLPNFKLGKIARSSSILQAETQAIEGWRDAGHPKVRVANRAVVADHETNSLEAVIAIDPGATASYGEVRVRNTSEKMRLDEDYIVWMSGLKPGQIYNAQDLKRAQKRLARLDVFRSFTLNEAEEISADGSLPITLDVQERAPRRIGAGAAYSTLDGTGLNAYWLHRNLFGSAERLRLDAKISGIGGSHDNSYHPENYSYSLAASFTRPGLFTPDTDFITNAKIEREVLENYTATGLYLQSGLAHIFNDELTGRVTLNASRARTSDVHFGGRNFTLVGVNTMLEFDGRDDKNNAKSGLYAQAVLEPNYEAEYGNFLTKSVFEGRAYQALDAQGRFVLAMRAKMGMLFGAPAKEIPSNMLFFAGGGGSVRGYGYRNIGVKVEGDKVIGGRSLVEASGEVRAEVTADIGLVGFVDVGQVGENSLPDFSRPLRWGTGIGLRYKTGLGPLRLDVARPLDGEKGDPDLGIYIGIGQSF